MTLCCRRKSMKVLFSVQMNVETEKFSRTQYPRKELQRANYYFSRYRVEMSVLSVAYLYKRPSIHVRVSGDVTYTERRSMNRPVKTRVDGFAMRRRWNKEIQVEQYHWPKTFIDVCERRKKLSSPPFRLIVSSFSITFASKRSDRNVCDRSDFRNTYLHNVHNDASYCHRLSCGCPVGSRV